MNHGFTLVEMLVVLVIMGVVSTAVIVALPATPRADARAAAEEYAMVLRHTRQIALRQGSIYRVNLAASGKYFVESEAGLEIRDGTLTACGSRLHITSPGHHTLFPSGLIMGDTVLVGCDGSTARLTLRPLEGVFAVE